MSELSRNTQGGEIVRYINLKLAALGQPTSRSTADPSFLEIAGPLLRNYYQKDQLLGDRLCPADARIQAFLDAYLRGRVPGRRAAAAGEHVRARPSGAGARHVAAAGRRSLLVAVPELLPRARRACCTIRRATAAPRKGIFHIVEGGLPIPADKIAVPKRVVRALAGRGAAAARRRADAAVHRRIRTEQARLFVSLLLRPLVCPATGSDPAKTMEIRFFAPASLVSNLDFVETHLRQRRRSVPAGERRGARRRCTGPATPAA